MSRAEQYCAVSMVINSIALCTPGPLEKALVLAFALFWTAKAVGQWLADRNSYEVGK